MSMLEDRALKVVDDLGETATNAAAAARDRANKAAQAATVAMKETSAAVKDNAEKAMKIAQKQGTASVKQVGGMISRSPWTSVAVAATVGYLLARPWRRSEGADRAR